MPLNSKCLCEVINISNATYTNIRITYQVINYFIIDLVVFIHVNVKRTALFITDANINSFSSAKFFDFNREYFSVKINASRSSINGINIIEWLIVTTLIQSSSFSFFKHSLLITTSHF